MAAPGTDGSDQTVAKRWDVEPGTSAVEASRPASFGPMDWAAGHAADPDGVVIESRNGYTDARPCRIRGDRWQAWTNGRQLALGLGERAWPGIARFDS